MKACNQYISYMSFQIHTAAMKKKYYNSTSVDQETEAQQLKWLIPALELVNENAKVKIYPRQFERAFYFIPNNENF